MTRSILIILILLMAAYIAFGYNPAPTSQLDGRDAAVIKSPSYLPGVAQTLDNPYGNPMPYGGGVEVRSQKPSVSYFQDDSLQRIYKGTDVNSEGWFFNTIPDPTLMARPVYWTQNPQPDIVSKEADCSYRFCY
jgi:hypothetical protein